MACSRCVESVASGATICGFCGEPLGEMEPAARIAGGMAGFITSIASAFLGGLAGLEMGLVGTGLGTIGGAVVPFLLARSAGASNFAAGAVVGVVTVVIVFGGCLTMLG